LLSFRAQWPQIANGVVYNAMPQLTLRGGWLGVAMFLLLASSLVVFARKKLE
jgi:hypothetical protein